MVRNGPTTRWHGGTSARLGLSACILVPPLLMAAGMAFFDSLPPQSDRPQPTAQEPPVPQSIVAKTVSAAGVASSFGLANTEMHAVVIEKRPVIGQPPATEPTGRTADATDYYGPVPVTVVRIRKAGAQPEVAELGAATPIVATPKIARRLPVATRNHVAVHARGKSGRHAPHVSHPVKPQHGPHAPNYAGQRPSIRRHTR
jgi:hypothetical protein